MQPISPKALQLILQSEGLNQPGIWPGGASGITIGIGYDLGYTTIDRFESDWNKAIPGPTLLRLREVIGLTGIKAKNKAVQLADIKIKRAESEKIFTEKTIPQEQLRTQIAFPGLENLPADAQGALVSLVYNRGASMIDSPGKDNRKEMRAIKVAVAKGDLKEIAKQLRSMKRLWEGKGLNGLIKRREDEALLVEGSIA
jgi:GH24 family phage-related lysozyme (muramidase)